MMRMLMMMMMMMMMIMMMVMMMMMMINIQIGYEQAVTTLSLRTRAVMRGSRICEDQEVSQAVLSWCEAVLKEWDFG